MQKKSDQYSAWPGAAARWFVDKKKSTTELFLSGPGRPTITSAKCGTESDYMQILINYSNLIFNEQGRGAWILLFF